MLTDAQQKFLEKSARYEELKAEMKELKPEMDELLTEIGVGAYFQDPNTKLVYKVTVPKGRYVYNEIIGYDRTKKSDEKRGDLSKKEAQEAGFEL